MRMGSLVASFHLDVFFVRIMGGRIAFVHLNLLILGRKRLWYLRWYEKFIVLSDIATNIAGMCDPRGRGSEKR